MRVFLFSNVWNFGLWYIMTNRKWILSWWGETWYRFLLFCFLSSFFIKEKQIWMKKRRFFPSRLTFFAIFKLFVLQEPNLWKAIHQHLLMRASVFYFFKSAFYFFLTQKLDEFFFLQLFLLKLMQIDFWKMVSFN